MKTAYQKDIFRTIRKNGRRFFAIIVITALGLTAFSGIYATCRDLYRSADRFYDGQKLFDVQVLSTMGLTDDDVAVLQNVSGVSAASGGYSETVRLSVNEARQTADVHMISLEGLNMPYVLQGTLPQVAGEIAVTQEYIDASGQSIGDVISIEETEFASEDEKAENDDSENTAGKTSEANDVDETGGTDEMDIDWDADVEIEEDVDTPSLQNTQYRITGIVATPLNIANNNGGQSARSAGSADYLFFITPDDVNSDYYTSVYLTLNGLEEMDCYSEEYKSHVKSVTDYIENQIMAQREQARHDEILAKAISKISEAENTMNEKFADADKQFNDAWAQIEEVKKEISDGESALTAGEKSALQQLASVRAEMEAGRQKLQSADAGLTAAQAELDANVKELEAGKAELAEQRKQALEGFAAAEQVFMEKQASLEEAHALLIPQINEIEGALGDQWPAPEWAALVGAATSKTEELLESDPQAEPDPEVLSGATGEQQLNLALALAAIIASDESFSQDPAAYTSRCIQTALSYGIVSGGRQSLDAQKAVFDAIKTLELLQLESAEKKLEGEEAALNEALQQTALGRAEIEKEWEAFYKGEEEFNQKEKETLQGLASAWQKLADGKRELTEGEETLKENESKYHAKQAEARQKIADAYADLDDIDMTQWYIMDRTSLESYTSLDTDMTSIGAIGKAFPILFLVVAILISLTTMTRMVEEERGLIGTYKALGFSDALITRKYLVYALLASVLGSVLGLCLGFIVLPKLLIGILRSIYVIPNVTLSFDLPFALIGVIIFMVSILFATLFACRNELFQTPASLMRPKAPRAGSRILLEKIPALWHRLKFLDKVTARNLFRYKKRLFMTIIGIAGCTALVLTGFGIRDSVTDMLPKQYENISRYDLMIVSEPESGDDLLKLLSDDENIADDLPVQVENIKIFNSSGASESTRLIVVPFGGKLEDYIYTPNKAGELVTLGTDGVLLTQNAAKLLDISPGDEIAVQNMKLDQQNVTVQDVIENYLGNHVIMSQKLYESLFGAYKPDGAFAHFAGSVADQAAYSDKLRENDYVMSSVSTQALKDHFSTDFLILNSVVLLLIVLAAVLAFAVLFTLSNTNISERIRELATIKVLGFFDREVHSYVNRETLILTLIGIVIGLPLGYLLSGAILSVLVMPSLEFVLVVQPLSYLYAALTSFGFALIVDLITDRSLDRIDAVEALKSAE